MQLVMKHITHMLRFVVASRKKLNVVAGLGFCGFFAVRHEVSVPRPPTKAMTGLVGTAWGGSFRRV